MKQAIQLDLFRDQGILTASSTQKTVIRKSGQNEAGRAMASDPCKTCHLLEWCSSDDCARKCYPVDVPTTRFKNLEQYIRFLKHYDWI